MILFSIPNCCVTLKMKIKHCKWTVRGVVVVNVNFSTVSNMFDKHITHLRIQCYKRKYIRKRTHKRALSWVDNYIQIRFSNRPTSATDRKAHVESVYWCCKCFSHAFVQRCPLFLCPRPIQTRFSVFFPRWIAFDSAVFVGRSEIISHRHTLRMARVILLVFHVNCTNILIYQAEIQWNRKSRLIFHW